MAIPNFTPLRRTKLRINPLGHRYGRLVVECEVARTSRYQRRVRCRCDCGKFWTGTLERLRAGMTNSCGCLQRERASDANTTHGQTAGINRFDRGPEYRAWCNIKTRCYNPHSSFYSYYGGRGIAMSDRWRKSFAAFLADIGHRPSPKHSIDRYPDRNGPYSKENTRWATRREQANNMRTNVTLSFQGETHTLAEWARLRNLPVGRLSSRVRLGWPTERILAEPPSFQRRSTNTLITADGVTRPLYEWATITGIRAQTLMGRIRCGWTTERAMAESLRSRNHPNVSL